jgi:Uma2 family endonuclease
MSTGGEEKVWTTADLLALPEDGMQRWLIRGHLWEKPMTVRNRTHSLIEANIVHILNLWRDRQPEPRGAVLCGEVGCRLQRDPDTTVGVDVVYLDPELAAAESDETTLVDGVPVLCVEILSPGIKQEETDEKITQYLAAEVALVWVVNPRFRTITVYRPDAEPELFNANEELTAETHLPGFRVAVRQIFEN